MAFVIITAHDRETLLTAADSDVIALSDYDFSISLEFKYWFPSTRYDDDGYISLYYIRISRHYRLGLTGQYHLTSFSRSQIQYTGYSFEHNIAN